MSYSLLVWLGETGRGSGHKEIPVAALPALVFVVDSHALDVVHDAHHTWNLPMATSSTFLSSSILEAESLLHDPGLWNARLWQPLQYKLWATYSLWYCTAKTWNWHHNMICHIIELNHSFSQHVINFKMNTTQTVTVNCPGSDSLMFVSSTMAVQRMWFTCLSRKKDATAWPQAVNQLTSNRIWPGLGKGVGCEEVDGWRYGWNSSAACLPWFTSPIFFLALLKMEAILALAVLFWFLRVRKRTAGSSSSSVSWAVLVSDSDPDSDGAMEKRSSEEVELSWESESELAMSHNGTVKHQKLVQATVRIMKLGYAMRRPWNCRVNT